MSRMSSKAARELRTLDELEARLDWNAALERSLAAERDDPDRIDRARGRIGRQVDGTELSDPVPEHRDRALPPDPLGDHGRWHLRPGLQQLADPRLESSTIEPRDARS